MGATSEESSSQPLAGRTQQSYGTYDTSSPQYQTYQGYPVIQSESPPVLQRNEHEGSQWTTGLCGCLSDIPNCVFTMFCPCLAFGRVAEHLDDGNTSCITASLVWYVIQQLTSCGCIYSYAYRKKLRNKYNLPNVPFPDWFLHYFCWFCAICQVRALHRCSLSSCLPPCRVWFTNAGYNGLLESHMLFSQL